MPSRPRSNPKIEDENLRSYFLDVFTGSGSHLMHKQRSMVVTNRIKPDIQNRIEELLSEIRDMGYPDWKFYFFDQEEIGESNLTLIPEDPTIFAINRPIVLARKSQTTGKVYYRDFKVCPQTGNKLIPIIQSQNEQ